MTEERLRNRIAQIEALAKCREETEGSVTAGKITPTTAAKAVNDCMEKLLFRH